MKKVRLLYNLAFPFVLLALLPSFLLRMIRRGKYRHKFGQRFAIYSPRVLNKLRRDGNVWVHAVSVGEVLIALKLIGEMKRAIRRCAWCSRPRRRPDSASPAVGAPSGWNPLNPVDFILVAKRAMRIVRPKVMILVEERLAQLTARPRRRARSSPSSTPASRRARSRVIGR